MQSLRVVASVACVAATLAAGCANPQPPAPQPDPEPTMTSTPSPQSGPEATAVADLAGRLEVEESEIEVVSVDEVTWRDGSLGCPKPGRLYTQALVDGIRIVLRVDDKSYEYHSGAGREPFLCEDPQPPLSDS